MDSIQSLYGTIYILTKVKFKETVSMNGKFQSELHFWTWWEAWDEYLNKIVEEVCSCTIQYVQMVYKIIMRVCSLWRMLESQVTEDSSNFVMQKWDNEVLQLTNGFVIISTE